MNVWQKLCIAAGALVIALMFLAFPVKATKEVPVTGFGRTANPLSTIIETYSDYTATALRAIGILAGTATFVILLGFIPKRKD